MGRADTAGRDDGGARPPRPAGQGALHRLLELFRLAHHEGARHRPDGRAPALRQPADPLHAAGARSRIRTGADLARPGPRHSRLEPARRRPALRQVPPRRPRRGRKAPATSAANGASRRSTTRTSSTTSSMSSSTLPRRTSARRRAWRSPGCIHQPAVTSVIIGGRTQGAVRRQPRVGRPQAHRGRAQAARRGVAAEPRLSLLAPDLVRPTSASARPTCR